MSDERPSSAGGSDIVVIGKDDISNYNPGNILPQSENTIVKIREWLRPTEYNIESSEYRKHLAFHLKGTGEWLHHSENYLKWHDSPDHGLLWIKGVPGSGKSVVAASMIRKLSQEEVPVLYFFFRQIVDANHRPINLLRDWLDQILIYCPQLQAVLMVYVEESRSLDSVSINELWRHLREALASMPRVYCVADALDEMDDGNSGFITQMAELGHCNSSSIKVLLTSRPTANVESAMRGIKSLDIRMEEKLVDVDIATYVRHCLLSTSISDSDQQLVKEAVPGRANGLFLYAKLAMKAFLEPGADIEETIRKLPLDLDAMYIGILQEHARRSGISEKTQVTILQWVTHATRPLRLLELADMLKTADGVSDSYSLKENKDLVRAACGPLLEILPDEAVSVVHHSLTEFLIGTSRTKHPPVYPILASSPTHYDLAIVCLNYLCSGWLRNETLNLDSLPLDHTRINLKLPFAAYAMANWHVHTVRSKWKGSVNDILTQNIERFFGDINARNNWLKLYFKGPDRVRTEEQVKLLSDLHLAALCGLTACLPALVGRLGHDILDARDTRERTPLWWAASSGHADVVDLLLQYGAAPDIPDSDNYSPLYVAAMNDNSEVVQLLVGKGVSPITIHPKYQGEDTSLLVAADYGHVRSLEAMLPFCDAHSKRSALRLASMQGRHLFVKRLLREPDVDPNDKTGDETALFLAAKHDNAETIGVLISAGADTSIRCRVKPDHWTRSKPEFEHPWSTALIELFERQSVFIARPYISPHYMTDLDCSKFDHALTLLIQAGADVNERDSLGRAPIHSAQFSYKLRRLLEEGADPNAETKDGRTALHCLPKVNDLEYLKLLVEQAHMDINKREYCKGMTPLLSAIRHDSDLAISMPKFGSDCTATDIEGNGSLHYACSYYERVCINGKTDNKLPKLMRALLEGGADPRLANCDGETPLHILAARGGFSENEVRKILLDHGADIEARDAKGKTPLFRLIGRSPRPINITHEIEGFTNASASLDVRDNCGRTLLHETIYSTCSMDLVQRKFTETYQYFCDAGVPPSEVDFRGNTLCHELVLAPSCTHFSGAANAFFSLFRKAGLDMDAPNYTGTTPLHLACQMRLDGEHKCNYHAKGCFEWLLDHSSDPNVADKKGLRAIHFAASTNTYTVNRLLRAGADPFVATNQGMNALHIASRCKRSSSLGLLLQRMTEISPEAKKAALNQKDICQYTPLHYASRSGIIESVLLLIEAGADVNPSFDTSRGTICSEPWYPPILQCVFFEREQQLWKRGPWSRKPRDDERQFWMDIGKPLIPNLAIAAGYTVESRERHFEELVSGPHLELFDPVYESSRYDEIIKALLAAGADVFQGSHGSESAFYHAMMFAANEQEDYITNLLWNCRDQVGELDFPTPVHVEISESRARRQAETTALSEAFLSRAKETNWRTVGRLLSKRHFSLITEIYKAGADYTAVDANGDSILSRLVEYGFYELVDDCCSPEDASKFDDAQQVPDQTTTEWKLEPLLVVACKRFSPNMEVIRVLVEKKGVDINARGKGSLTALHVLARGTHWWQVAQAIPYLISKGATMEARDNEERTPLLYALTEKGSFLTAATKLLVENGADVDAVDSKGNGCLSTAAFDEEIVRLLVTHGAEVSPKTILVAIKAWNPNLLTILLSSPKIPNLVASWKLTLDDVKKLNPCANPVEIEMIRQGHPLLSASSKWLVPCDPSEKSVKDVQKEHMKAFLAAGFSPYDTFPVAVDKVRLTFRPSSPTSIASHAWHKKDSRVESIAQFKTGHGNRIKIPIMADRMILHQILRGSGPYEPILDLPDLDLELRDGSGETLLLAACQRVSTRIRGQVPMEGDELLRLLLDMGADPYVTDNYERNAIHHKLGSRDLDDEKLKGLNHFRNAIPALINQADADGYRPLHYGLAELVHGQNKDSSPRTQGHQAEPAWLDYILSQGADMLVTDSLGNNALHFLASGVFKCFNSPIDNTRGIFERFLKLGLDINARNNAGQTPAFFLDRGCLRSEIDEVMSWLDELGVDWHAKDEKQRTILHELANDSVYLFEAIMERGVDPLAEDIDGRSTLDLVTAYNNKLILDLFDGGDED